MPTPEHWPTVYRERPDIFDAFCRAEDPEGRIVARLAAHAALEGTTVLEVGCGTGRTSLQLAAIASAYVALDASVSLLKVAPQRGAGPWLVQARAEAVPLKAGTMDRVLGTWVLAYLRPEARIAALREAERVLRPGPGAGVWLVENHWEGEFQALRDREGYGAEPGVKALVEASGFQVVEVVETELRFRSPAEAASVLGALCGETVAAKLRMNPRSRIGHSIVILHLPA